MHASDVEQFARDNKDTLQIVGVGSQDSFPEAIDFLGDTGIGGADSELTMLWEGTGNLWRINGVRTNSAMQLYTHDLSQASGVIFFNGNGRDVVLDAVVTTPWAPDDSPHLAG